MSDDDSSKPPEDPDSGRGQATMGWSIIGYLIAGMAVWGGVGWLVDAWLDLPGIATMIGLIVGTAGAIFLIVKKVST